MLLMFLCDLTTTLTHESGDLQLPFDDGQALISPCSPRYLGESESFSDALHVSTPDPHAGGVRDRPPELGAPLRKSHREGHLALQESIWVDSLL